MDLVSLHGSSVSGLSHIFTGRHGSSPQMQDLSGYPCWMPWLLALELPNEHGFYVGKPPCTDVSCSLLMNKKESIWSSWVSNKSCSFTFGDGMSPIQALEVLFWLQHSASFLSKATEPESKITCWIVIGRFLTSIKSHFIILKVCEESEKRSWFMFEIITCQGDLFF